MTDPAPDPPRDEVPEPLPPEEEYADLPRRYPSTIGGFCYLLVLVVVGIGLYVVGTSDWRDGAKWIGGALIGAAVIRLVLRSRSAGMLAVRNRFVDAALLSAVGGAVIFLSESIPNQPF
ncbi:MAG: DUF3017 domain-containing protein [Nocardioides sp.]